MNVQNAISNIAATLRRVQADQIRVSSQQALVNEILTKKRSADETIDAMPGRRLTYRLSGDLDFTTDDEFQRGNPISLLVSQDGPFIWTHFPVAAWRPTAPANADMFGLWRPVVPYPLPNQFAVGSVDGDTDLISISYEMADAGSQRNLDNQASLPVLSRIDAPTQLPVPAVFTPNSVINFTPTFERILFNNTNVPATAGRLRVTLLGYRIVNM